MGRFLRRLMVVPLAALLAFSLATTASASHDPKYFYGAGATEQQAVEGARASLAAYEQREGVDCVERSLWTQFDWEYEFWEANLSADCPPDSLEDRYFYGAGSTEGEAVDGARASLAAYQQREGVDCTEESLWTEFNWEYEFWEANLRAVCDFG